MITTETDSRAPMKEPWAFTTIVYSGVALTQEESNALADRIHAVIAHRKRIGADQRMRARLNQIRSIERGPG